MKKLTKDGKPNPMDVLLARVNDGDEHTIKEWASILDLSYERMTTLLSQLRKRGDYIYPVAVREGEAGILRNVISEKSYASRTVHRMKNSYVEPTIRRFLNLTEATDKQFKTLRKEHSQMLTSMSQLLK